MSIKRMLAILCIFLIGAAGWWILGTASQVRSDSMSLHLSKAVIKLWGDRIVQTAPSMTVKVPGTKRLRELKPISNKLDVDIELEQRRKGLIWYPTYQVDFSGKYTVKNTDEVKQKVRLHFPFPSNSATYDQINFKVDDREQDIDLDVADGVNHIIDIEPGQARSFTINYRTRGISEWRYQLTPDKGQVHKLDMTVKVNFFDIDFAEGSLSPMEKKELEQGYSLQWLADDLITHQDVSIIMPEKLNPGPLAVRMSYFAPVCLVFFFVLITAICILQNISIHPMHYLFVTASFFAFHLLFSYLVDIINVHISFVIASIVSISLVIFYLSIALGKSFPWKIAAIGQFFYLILFSYSFFLEGMTGLTVTIGSILTLAVLMGMTARLDWETAFGKK